jgi:hypothetical protein
MKHWHSIVQHVCWWNVCAYETKLETVCCRLVVLTVDQQFRSFESFSGYSNDDKQLTQLTMLVHMRETIYAVMFGWLFNGMFAKICSRVLCVVLVKL